MMTASLGAWHNDPQLKNIVVAALRADLEQDRYIRGVYAELFDGQWRGCHVGCLVMAARRAANHGSLEVLVSAADEDGSWHQHVEELYGFPRGLAYLWDRVYEDVPKDDAPTFAVASIEAITPGADLSLVGSQVMADLLSDPEHGGWQWTAEGSRQRAAVETVAGLYARRLAGDEPSNDEWVASRRACAAYAATYAAACAAYAATYAAACAAYAAYAAGDAYAAAAAAYTYVAAAGSAATSAKVYSAWIGNRIIHHTHNTPTRYMS